MRGQSIWQLAMVLIALLIALLARPVFAQNEPFSQPAIGAQYEVGRLVGHRGPVTAMAITPDGRVAISGSTDQQLIVWDVPARKPIRTMTGLTDTPVCVAITPDGRRAVTGDWAQRMCVWDLQTGALLSLTHFSWHVHSVAIAADGRTVIGGSCAQYAAAVDVEKDQTLWEHRGNGQAHAVAVNADGSRFAVAHSFPHNDRKPPTSGEIFLYARDGTQQGKLADLRSCVFLKFSSDGQRLHYFDNAAGAGTGDASDPKPVVGAKFPRTGGRRGHVDCSDDGRTFVLVSENGAELTVLRPATEPATKPRRLAVGTEYSRSVALAGDGRTVLVGGGGGFGSGHHMTRLGRDSVIRILDLDRPRGKFALGPTPPAKYVVVRPDGSRHLLDHFKPAARFYDVATGKVEPVDAAVAKGVIAWSQFQALSTHDGQSILVLTGPGEMQLRSWKDFSVQRTLPLVYTSEVAAALSPDDRYLVSGMKSIVRRQVPNVITQDVQVLDLQENKRLADLPIGDWAPAFMDFTADGRRVVMGLFERRGDFRSANEQVSRLQCWDVTTAKKLWETEIRPTMIKDLRVTRGGTVLIAAGVTATGEEEGVTLFAGGRILRLDAATGKTLPDITDLRGMPTSVQAIGDGTQLLVTTRDCVYCLDAATGQALDIREVASDAPNFDRPIEVRALKDGRLLTLGFFDPAGVVNILPLDEKK